MNSFLCKPKCAGRILSKQSFVRLNRHYNRILKNRSILLIVLLVVIWLSPGCNLSLTAKGQPTTTRIENQLVPTVEPTATRISPRSATNNVVVAIPNDPVGFDPHLTVSPVSFQITRNIYDTLLGVNEKGELRAVLADRWSINEDGRTWSFSLKDHVLFGNGHRLTARDVAYSIERLIDPATANLRASDYGVIDSINISDTLSIDIHLREPKSTLGLELANDWAVIVPDESEDQLYAHPMGTGPFRLKEWEKGNYIILERSRSITGTNGLAPDEIVFRVIPEESERILAIQSGNVDIVAGLSISATQRLWEDRDISLWQIPAREAKVLAFNHARPPFDDLRVRQAICYGIDRQSLINVVWAGAATVAGGEFSSSDPYYTDLTAYYPYDVLQAKALLGEAGHTQGLDTTITVPMDEEYLQLAEVLVRQLAEIGVRVETIPVDWTVFLNQVYFGREFDLTFMTHKGKIDPLAALVRYKSDSFWNYLNYTNPKYDELLDNVAQANAEDLADGLTALQRLLVEDAMVAYLGSPLIMTAVRNEVKGCRLLPDGLCDLREVYKEPLR